MKEIENAIYFIYIYSKILKVKHIFIDDQSENLSALNQCFSDEGQLTLLV